MSKCSPDAVRALLIAGVCLGSLATENAIGSLILNIDQQPGDNLTAPLDSNITGPQPIHGSRLPQAVGEGHWGAACTQVTRILAKQQPDVDALGIFALCAAIRNEKAAANTALARLKEAEALPGYYAQMTWGILLLRDNAPDKAVALFKQVLADRPGDPLAAYFSGEALHAYGKDTEAIAAFRATLSAWPQHAPALSALARLTTKGNASSSTLKSAIEMAERATRIDPGNRGYWQQLADLHELAGNQGQANAIRLQWLKPRPLPK